MQTAAPEAFDIEREPEHVKQALRPRPEALRALRRAMPDGPAAGRARRALRADLFRRHGEPAELGRPRGHRRQPPRLRRRDRQPIAGLLADLEQRGLLDETLVIWGGEFGRLPIAQKGSKPGPRPQPARLHLLAGRRRRQGRRPSRRDRRDRPQSRRGQGERQRPARHHPAPARPRPRTADLPLQRPRLPPDRRRGRRGEAVLA